MTETADGKMGMDEARAILEDLARRGPPSVQVAAIKVLREMDKEEKAAAAEIDRHLTGIAELDQLYAADDGLTAERSRRPGEPAA